MGIQGLMKLIADVAPNSYKETDIKSYFGRKIAIDASMSLYQFLIAIRSEGSQLTDADGETTSHLMGTFYRTIRLIENGIKPVYVFDGKPPEMKSLVLDKRTERREEAQKALTKAEEAEDVQEANKISKKLVKVKKEHTEECKELLKLMGIPYIEAPSEAEAQCAALVKAGKVYATATEDMDALIFGSEVLVRHLSFSEARKIPIQEIHLPKVLNEMNLNQNEFIDLSILLGCDYCESIHGIGPKRAFELIKKHRNLESIIQHLNGKYTPPENWIYKEARELFLHPEVADPGSVEMKWTEPDVEGLVKFLCGSKQFNEDRVRSGASKLAKARTGQTQVRLDSFFKVLPSTPNPKRKTEEKPKPNKKLKGNSSRRPK